MEEKTKQKLDVAALIILGTIAIFSLYQTIQYGIEAKKPK